ncbi:hypothetical protein A8H35_15265 [Burkholderia thailandensis]|nr:hypothetical protein A8H35_15265 [Burkholderia thailandensis]PHH37974.1 hypothetical protein CRX59_16145 [Burkholderia thailandensis]
MIGHREIVSATLSHADRLNAAKHAHIEPIGEARKKRNRKNAAGEREERIPRGRNASEASGR